MQKGIGPATMIKNLKAELSEVEKWKHWRNRERGKWYWAGSLVGDICDRNKRDVFTVEVSRYCDCREVEETVKRDFKKGIYPRQHQFLIQAEFDRRPNERKGKIITWLEQGGQIITFGAPAVEFEHGDFESFIAALRKAMNQDMPTTLKTLYKSGYDRYGCA